MTIRAYQAGDERQIQELYKRVFDKERSLAHWKWKFNQAPHTLNPWIRVFEEDGKILGHIALWINTAFVNGEEVPIGLRVDTMVDEKARGKGIYRLLNETLLKDAEQSGVAYLYGFPAPKAKELFIHYTNAKHLTNIARYVYIQNPVALAATKLPFLDGVHTFGKRVKRFRSKRYKQQLSQEWEVRELNKASVEFDRLAQSTKSDTPVHLKRDAAFINWRYLYHPDYDYKLLAIYNNENRLRGFSVIRQEDKVVGKNNITVGYIIDLLADSQEVGEQLLNETMQRLSDNDLIQAWALPESQLATILNQSGFKHKDNPMPIVGKALMEETDLCNDPANWHISLGDVDSF